MTEWAMVFGGMNSEVGYYLPLLRHGTYEQAVEAALEYIDSGETISDDGDTRFKIINIVNVFECNTADHQEFFEKKAAAHRKYQQEQREKSEREQFERLKKKFE